MSEQNWYYLDPQGQQQGPVPATNLQSLAQAGALNAETQVWTEGLEAWVPASQVEGLINTPQPQHAQQPIQPQLTATSPLIASTPTTQPVQGTPVGAPQNNPYSAPQASPQQTAGTYPPTIAKGGSFGKLVGFYLLGIALWIIPMLLAGGLAQSGKVSDEAGAGIAIGMVVAMFIGWGCMMVSGILYLIYISRAWTTLQPGGATITPGKAIGFLFIPLFNIVWMFMMFPKLAKEWNLITANFENTKRAPKFSETWFLLLCIPFINLIAFFIAIPQLCNGITFMANLNRPGFGTPSGGGGLNFGPATIKTNPTLTPQATAQPTNPNSPTQQPGGIKFQ